MRWVGIAAAFIALQLCVAAMLAVAVEFYAPPPILKYATTAAFPILFYAGGFAFWSLRSKPDRPTTHLMSLDWTPVRRFAGAMTLVWLQFVALTWMKGMLPAVTYFWADIPLAGLERAVFGRDAWTFFPKPNRLLEILYLMWSPIVCISFVSVYFSKSRRREALLLSFFLTIGLLGSFGQYLLPSGGPIFFERLGLGNRFEEMTILHRTEYLADVLWVSYLSKTVYFGSGISAFPSIHVAATTWIVIALRHWTAYLYLGVIFIGSVTLGWHYAIDGIAGAIGAVLCYRAAVMVLSLELAKTFKVIAIKK